MVVGRRRGAGGGRAGLGEFFLFLFYFDLISAYYDSIFVVNVNVIQIVKD